MRYRANNHWGNHFWGLIHTITIIDFESNEMYNNNIKNILMNLQNVFPCHSCKYLYTEYLKQLDNMDMSKSMVLFYWSVDLHNTVNKKLNKEEWTYEKALEKWTYKVEG